MNASINQVATGLAARLGTISGLRTYTYQPEQLNPPVAFPTIEQVTYHKAMSGGDVVQDWTITVIVGRYTDRTAQSLLDTYLSYSGASSVRAAIESDRTLGGVAKTLILTNGASINAVTQGDADFLQITLQCQVHA
jgi:hypothetical protein